MIEPITELKIACQGATTVQLDELHDLQGDLKDLTEANYVKLRNSMTQYGFSFPIFIWIDIDGTKYTVDAHQRTRTLKKMREEGITIPPLPADIIHAESKTEAKKKLLLLNSRYGKITEEGFQAFTQEPGFEIESQEIADMLEIPEIDLSYGEEGDMDDSPTEQKLVECPNCKLKFTPE